MNINFEIGIWNAWLPMLFYLVFTMFFSYMLNSDGYKRGGDMSWLTPKDKRIITFSSIAFYTILILGIWLPLKTSTNLFYVGLVLYIVGIILSGIVSANYVTAPKNKLISKGLYQFSRNPIYVLNAWIVISIALMSNVWILFFILLIHLILNHFAILAEERYCEETYGESYNKYKQKVRRYL